jgi:hypothetical protein
MLAGIQSKNLSPLIPRGQASILKKGKQSRVE